MSAPLALHLAPPATASLGPLGPVALQLTAPLESVVVRLALAAALGMFLGLEREWSHKSAGIRTFALVSLLAAVFTVVGEQSLVVIGGVLVIVQGVLLAVQGLMDDTEADGLSLTTSVSMLVAYGVGALVASGQILEGVTVAVLSSLLLVLKRELHTLAWGLSREELRSAAEFGILAFVVYPILPASYPIAIGSFSVDIEPRVIWLMVVTVAGIGIVNYAIVRAYGGRGIAFTGFFGGVASSTAVVGAMLDHVRQRPETSTYAVAAILLADAAMALRNLVIAIAFTFPDRILVDVIAPLGVIVIGGIAIAAYTADWREEVAVDLASPFSLRYALGFGAVFLAIVVVGAAAQVFFGSSGLYVTSLLAGLVSSAGAATSAIVLYRANVIAEPTAVIAILLATAASVVVKVGLTATASNRRFAWQVATWSTVLLVVAGAVTLLVAV